MMYDEAFYTALNGTTSYSEFIMRLDLGGIDYLHDTEHMMSVLISYGLVEALRKRFNHLRFTEDGFYHGRDSDDVLGCRMCDGSTTSQMMLDIRGDL